MSTSSRDTGLVDELRDGLAEAKRQTAEVRELTAPLSERQFGWQRPDGGWSVGQCLTHLTLATRTFLADVEPAVAEARKQGRLGTGPYRGTWFGRIFRWILEPPPKIKVRTFQNLEPPARGRKGPVVDEFVSVQEALTRSMRRANGVDLGKVRVPSPMSDWLKWSVGQAFEITLAHNRRHVWQARQVVAHEEFPAG